MTPRPDIVHAFSFSWRWCMPSPDTLSMDPARAVVDKYAANASVIVDPFARNCRIGTHTNDLNPNTSAQYHMHADDFLRMLADDGVRADLVIFDPPYSPRQVSECYADAGLRAGMQDTQTARLKKRCRAAIGRLIRPGGHVISFGWNTTGMGTGYARKEIIALCHGGDHNDTLITVDMAVQGLLL